MATVRKTPNSPFWQAVITLPSGGRTNRSTKCKSKSEAFLVAAKFQDIANKGRDGSLITEHARKVLNDLLERAGQDTIHNDTTVNYLKEWLGGKTGSTKERYEVSVNAFVKHIGAKANRPLSSINHRDILSFIESRNKQGFAPTTVSFDAKALKIAFNTARKLSFISENPIEKALTLHPIETESSQRLPFHPQQVTTLLDNAEADWLTMILLGFYVGARIGDCADMEWSNINLEKRVIDFIQEKKKRRMNQKRVVCPLHPMLELHLRKLWSSRQSNSDFLCPFLAGLPTGGKTGLSERFLKLMVNAGIDPLPIQGKGKRMFNQLTFHSLRHCFNTQLANNGVPQEVRTKLTGHSSMEVNDGYTHFDIPRLKQAVDLLPMLNYRAKAVA